LEAPPAFCFFARHCFMRARSGSIRLRYLMVVRSVPLALATRVRTVASVGLVSRGRSCGATCPPSVASALGVACGEYVYFEEEPDRRPRGVCSPAAKLGGIAVNKTKLPELCSDPDSAPCAVPKITTREKR
jgi:hypothetical protein